ncbi:secreted protein containing Ig-like domain and vWFA domain [Terrimicrobium sacchariphilum]|uniref:Secreted protein containing Ig-like domain and vWFA domain n=1 Tax=Terrimicrobium sacchariphilum TaxID=690879 RepID=A0A146G926_TERSA|nr:VWA domain-containing protein [Terrimicrobium sacchariphilum]GAT33782.1 secreted protein containing Ig-like domain and vWFA domain [Terrimicrobium sacchariphilum]
MKTEDFRITQYALGELHGKDCEEFERELAASEELQHELEQTIAMSDRLAGLPRDEDTLTDRQRENLRNACAIECTNRKQRQTVQRVLAYAALVMGGIILATMSLPAITASLSKPSPAMLAQLEARRERKAEEVQVAAEKPQTMVAAAATPPALGDVAKTVPATDTPAEQTKSDSLAMALSANNLPVQELEQNSKKLLADGSASAAVTISMAPSVPTATMTAAPGNLEKTKEIVSGNVPLVGRLFASQAPATRGAARDQLDARAGTVRDEDRYRDRAINEARGMFNTETYDAIADNPFRETKGNELSTFSIDVDTASYANVRRFLQSEQLPPAGAVRIEELVNYFGYDYPQPTNGQPFSVNVEVSKAPWAPQHDLVRIALKGQEIAKGDRGPANLVFLIDVSGSMQPANKLPLLKRSLKALVQNLAPDDRVAIVVYAGSSGLVLPSTPGKDKTRILEALDNLEAGGSTNGAQGITLAYQTARENFLKGGNNRVILCTDGDFNVGVTNQSDLTDLIERERASGVFLSVLGFGEGNLKDSTMEKLADKGNGNYAYIDSFAEGRKVLVEQMNSTLFTIAKDVKVQVEFNPAQVAGYRLIGYENRILAKEDFNDDRKDAGEIGAGHTVTALYEVVPAGQPLPNRPSVDPLKYSEPAPAAEIDRKSSGDLLTVKLRYKAPDGDTSKLIEVPVKNTPVAFDEASADLQFAAAVAAFGMKLRNSPYAGDLSWSEIQKIARRNLGEDPGSYRAEFLTLIEKAARLQSGK